MINRFKILILKELLIMLRHKERLFASLCLPFVVFFILSFSFKDMMKKEPTISPLKVVIVDNDNSMASKMLISSFKGSKNFSGFIKIEVSTKSKAIKEFNDNLLIGIIEIPEDFSQSLLYMENKPLTITLNSREPLKSTILKNVFEGYAQIIGAVDVGVNSVQYYMDKYNEPEESKRKVNDNISKNLILTALGRSAWFSYETHTDIPSATSVEYYVIAIAVLLLMYTGMISGTLLIKDKKSMSISRLLTTSVTAFEIILSKWISYSIYCLALLMIFLAPLLLFYNMDMDYIFKNLFVFITISVGFIISFYVMIATFFSSDESYIMITNMYVFISAIIGGSFIPLQLMPEKIRNLSRLTPNYWIIKGGLNLMNWYSLNDIKNIIYGMLLLTICMLTASIYMLQGNKRAIK